MTNTEDLKTCHLTDIFRGPLVGYVGKIFQSKGQIIVTCTSHHSE
jgi:hypothetical protein